MLVRVQGFKTTYPYTIILLKKTLLQQRLMSLPNVSKDSFKLSCAGMVRTY